MRCVKLQSLIQCHMQQDRARCVCPDGENSAIHSLHGEALKTHLERTDKCSYDDGQFRRLFKKMVNPSVNLKARSEAKFCRYIDCNEPGD